MKFMNSKKKQTEVSKSVAGVIEKGSDEGRMRKVIVWRNYRTAVAQHESKCVEWVVREDGAVPHQYQQKECKKELGWLYDKVEAKWYVGNVIKGDMKLEHYLGECKTIEATDGNGQEMIMADRGSELVKKMLATEQLLEDTRQKSEKIRILAEKQWADMNYSNCDQEKQKGYEILREDEFNAGGVVALISMKWRFPMVTTYVKVIVIERGPRVGKQDMMVRSSTQVYLAKSGFKLREDDSNLQLGQHEINSMTERMAQEVKEDQTLPISQVGWEKIGTCVWAMLQQVTVLMINRVKCAIRGVLKLEGCKESFKSSIEKGECNRLVVATLDANVPGVYHTWDAMMREAKTYDYEVEGLRKLVSDYLERCSKMGSEYDGQYEPWEALVIKKTLREADEARLVRETERKEREQLREMDRKERVAKEIIREEAEKLRHEKLMKFFATTNVIS